MIDLNFEVLSLLIGILGILLALYQSRRAYFANKRAQIAEKAITEKLAYIAGEIAKNISRAASDGHEPYKNSVQEISHSESKPTSSYYIDINNDGIDELLVQFPSHLHSSTLQVYGVINSEFKLQGELVTDAPSSFEFDDIDGDGVKEIRATEINISSGLPYVAGLRDTVWYRFENQNFIEIKRESPPLDEIYERKKVFEK